MAHRRDTSLSREVAMLKTYRDSCHCGAVRFEVDLDLTQPSFRCSCSICRRTRFWPGIAGPDGSRSLPGEPELTQYRFNTGKNLHYFCRRCGVRAFGVGTEAPIGKMYGINLGCLEDVSDEEPRSRTPMAATTGWLRPLTTPIYDRHLAPFVAGRGRCRIVPLSLPGYDWIEAAAAGMIRMY